MTTTQQTETTVLAHHGITAAGGQNLIDAARDAGVIYACLGCGTIGQISREGYAHTVASVGTTFEQMRADTRDLLLDADPDAFECCSDADTIIY